MNSAQFQPSSINSQYYLTHIDSCIVQLVKAFSVEHSIKPDPDGKDMARAAIQDRLNALMTDDNKELVKDALKDLKYQLENNTYPGFAAKIFEIFKMMRLTNA